MLILYSITLFVSATLLCLLQPMFAKMALPLLGGAPAVWNTFMVFFQLSLLVGYVYAHITTNWFGVRRQAAMHVGLLLLALLTLPVAVPEGWIPPAQQNPVYWLLGVLLVEYPLALVAACLLNPPAGQRAQNRLNPWLDFALPLGIGSLLVGLVWAVEASNLETGVLSVSLMFGLPLVLCFSFHDRQIRFGLTVGAILLVTTFSFGKYGRVLHRERSFFGVYRVMLDAGERYRLLIHGSTNHGMQSVDPSRRHEPLSYYYPTGPLGQVFKVFYGMTVKSKVAIVGLGSGSMACYGGPDQHFVFYEIDPIIERIARNPRYFTFLRDCLPKIDVVLGDARLSLKAAPDRAYGLIVLDAFSSEAVPMHLLTREAIRLYLSKLAEGGILAFHASNRILDLLPILSELAIDAGLVSLTRYDSIISEAERSRGKLSSRWVVMARRERDFIGLSRDRRWITNNGQSNGMVWTDDFSNILSAIRWNQW